MFPRMRGKGSHVWLYGNLMNAVMYVLAYIASRFVEYIILVIQLHFIIVVLRAFAVIFLINEHACI